MICPNCGRRNSAGATFCSRCRQRLPLAAKLNGSHRRATMVEPRGGGGSGVIVLAVALLAGFLFVGGAAAIYLSSPPADPGNSLIGDGQASPTLPPFVQFTASPVPTPSPTFILLPSELFSPSPSDSGSFFVTPTPQVTSPPGGPTPTPRPTRTPDTGPTNPPTPKPVVARFSCAQKGTQMKLECQDNSKGNPTQWDWDFGEGQHEITPNASHDYSSYGVKTVKLVVTGPGGTSTETHTYTLSPEPTPSPTAEPTVTTAPTPIPCPTEPTPPPTPC